MTTLSQVSQLISLLTNVLQAHGGSSEISGLLLLQPALPWFISNPERAHSNESSGLATLKTTHGPASEQATNNFVPKTSDIL